MNNSNNQNLTPKRITGRPSRLSSIVTLIGSIVFLIFGVAFMGSVLSEAGEATTFLAIFMVIWIAACLGGVIYSMLNLASFKKSKPGATALDVFDVERRDVSLKNSDSRETTFKEVHPENKTDFGVRLRELESLRKEKFITEEEYQRKRQEILDEKW